MFEGQKRNKSTSKRRKVRGEKGKGERKEM